MSTASESTGKVCWKCGVELDLVQVGFRAVCDRCCAWLHCCKGCRHYVPGKPNDCAIPGTDPIRDREGANYCEEFAIRLGGSPPFGTTELFDRLFQ